MNKEFLTTEEINKAGFFYESDRSKCQSLKLRFYVPKDELVNDEFKKNIIEEIPFVYVHQVTETTNPYPDDPNFLADPKVLVIGHTLGTKLTRKWVKTRLLDRIKPMRIIEGAEFMDAIAIEIIGKNPKEGTPEYDRLDKLAGIILPVSRDLFDKFYPKLPSPRWIMEECSKFFDDNQELYEDLKQGISQDYEQEFGRMFFLNLERKYNEKIMKRYDDFKDINDVQFTKYKIIVPTEEDRKEVMTALEHCHDSADIDTDFVTVNQIVHEYEHGDASDKYSNIIVDKELYESICQG